MLPKIITPSQLRKNLATFLDMTSKELIVIKTSKTNKVIMDEKEYNRLSALANQFVQEDPEGKYLPQFEKEILQRSKNKDINESVESLDKLLCQR